MVASRKLFERSEGNECAPAKMAGRQFFALNVILKRPDAYTERVCGFTLGD